MFVFVVVFVCESVKLRLSVCSVIARVCVCVRAYVRAYVRACATACTRSDLCTLSFSISAAASLMMWPCTNMRGGREKRVITTAHEDVR